MWDMIYHGQIVIQIFAKLCPKVHKTLFSVQMDYFMHMTLFSVQMDYSMHMTLFFRADGLFYAHDIVSRAR